MATRDAHALDGNRGITQYAQTHFDVHDGLAHNLANSLAQTPDGYLWAGSEAGLTRYDGANFTHFDNSTREGIPANPVSALVVDRAGGLWVGMRDRGVIRMIDGEFRAVIWGAGAQDAQVQALIVDANGDLWVGLRTGGLVRLRAGVPAMALSSRSGLPDDDVRSILAARDGSVWIGTFRGLARWNAGAVVRGPAALDGISIDGIAEDRNGELWCATANGLAHLRGGFVEWVGQDSLPSRLVQRLAFDRDGNLWIGTAKGVARMTTDGRIERLPRPGGSVRALFEDSEGDLWIGTEGGLDRLRDGDVVPFGAAQGATDDPVFAIREDASGAMWIGSDDGILRIAPGQAPIRIAAGHGTVTAIFQDSRGDVWFGARDASIGRWHGGRFTWLGSRPWEFIRSFAETRDGLWLGTDKGLFRMRGNRVEDAEAVETSISIIAIAPDATGALWLATENGLRLWAHGKLVEIPSGGPPRNAPAMSIELARDGTMWLTTDGAGLWRLRDGRWFNFTTKDGLADDQVWRLLDDGRGNYWMSSNRGIWRVAQQQLEERAAGLRTTVESVLYGEPDGMLNRECDGADPAGWKAYDGRLWFPTVNGVAIIDPARLHPAPPPNALIESARIDSRRHAVLGDTLALAPGSNRLEIGYTAPTLRYPERLRFRYRLDGFDTDWNDAGAQRVAQYTNLAPGSYRFIVEAGRNGLWGRTGALAITLSPRFHQTRGFLALAIATIVLTIVSIPLLRIRQLRKRSRELSERVREAVHELAEREQRLRDTQAQLIEASRLAGRSDVATAVLHNVGNVLNSVNVSANLLKGTIGGIRTANLSKIAGLINDHRDDLARFLREDRRGQMLPEYFTQLHEALEHNKLAALDELTSLIRNIDHIEVIVRAQQSHVRRGAGVETFEVNQLVDDALMLSAATRDLGSIEVVRDVETLPPIRLDRHKALQILVNLLTNARDAIMAHPDGSRRITVRAHRGEPGNLELVVDDTGCGIAPDNLDKIFQLGFTTKTDGNGLGLHFSACAALELDGKLTASSPGVGQGTSLLLVLPFEPAAA